MVYVAKIGGHRQANAPSHSAGRMPLHCAAIGKALLAHADPAVVQQVLTGPLARRAARTIVAAGLLRRQLEWVVDSGIAFEREESAVGITCVAAPVLGVDDRPIAAVSMTGPVTRFRPEAHVDAVRAAAAALAATVARRRSTVG